MHKIKSITAAVLIAIAAIGLSAPTAAAPVNLIIDAAGQLTGAMNVNVGGTLYDVTFMDGTCTALFSPCDATSDFDFPDLATAELAPQALLDQVLIDDPTGQYDSDPSQTTGCDDTSCEILVPYGFLSFDPSKILAVSAFNAAMPNIFHEFDHINGVGFTRTDDTTLISRFTYALFAHTPPTSIPEPGTLLLFAVGLAFLAVFGRRRRQT